MKNRGPSIEPCGTPQICLKASDLDKLHSITKIVCYPLMAVPVMPHVSNFDSNISWFRVSKAFDKSINIPAKYFWRSTALATLFTKLIKAWEVEWSGRKPN